MTSVTDAAPYHVYMKHTHTGHWRELETQIETNEL